MSLNGVPGAKIIFDDNETEECGRKGLKWLS